MIAAFCTALKNILYSERKLEYTWLELPATALHDHRLQSYMDASQFRKT